jgi:hypothetical protein
MGSHQPGANKDVDVDDVAVASTIEATTEVETITTSEAPPSASTRATPKRGGSKSLPCRGRRCQRSDMVRPRREWTSSLVDASRRRQLRHLLLLMPRSSPLKPPKYGIIFNYFTDGSQRKIGPKGQGGPLRAPLSQTFVLGRSSLLVH